MVFSIFQTFILVFSHMLFLYKLFKSSMRAVFDNQVDCAFIREIPIEFDNIGMIKISLNLYFFNERVNPIFLLYNLFMYWFYDADKASIEVNKNPNCSIFAGSKSFQQKKIIFCHWSIGFFPQERRRFNFFRIRCQSVCIFFIWTHFSVCKE